MASVKQAIFSGTERFQVRMPAEKRQATHRDLARALESSGHVDPEALAIHYRGAGDSDRAARCAIRAAACAEQSLAFDHSARLYRMALELLPEGHPEARMLTVRLGDALAHSGRGAEAAEAYRAAAKSANAADALDLSRRAAQQLLITGHIDEGLAAVRAVLESEHIKYPRTPLQALLALIALRARIRLRGLGFKIRDESEVASRDLVRVDVCWHMGVGLSAVDTIRGQVFQSKSLLFALAAGEPKRLARALASEGSVTSSRGGAVQERVEHLLKLAEDISRDVEAPHLKAYLLGSRGTAEFLCGRFREALAHCVEAEEVFRERCTAVTWEIATVRLWIGRSLMYLGRIAELSQRVPAGLAECRDRGDLYGSTSLRAAVMPLVMLAADDPDRAHHEIREARARWSTLGYHLQHYYCLQSEVSALLYQGDGQRAYERLEEEWSALSRSYLLRVQFVRVVLLDARGRAALTRADGVGGDAKRWLGLALADAERLAQERMPWSEPLAKALRAGICGRKGDHARAARLLREAAQDFETAGMDLHAAAARRRLGELLGGDVGKMLVREADKWMVGQSVRSPERMAAMLVPPFATKMMTARTTAR
ncbi:MAG: hypothetical protein HY698_17770 [Deltaproteobacteria bacterium]|nr:hypothetical protein [Deltaproteobacteria bacterium]